MLNSNTLAYFVAALETKKGFMEFIAVDNIVKHFPLSLTLLTSKLVCLAAEIFLNLI